MQTFGFQCKTQYGEAQILFCGKCQQYKVGGTIYKRSPNIFATQLNLRNHTRRVYVLSRDSNMIGISH